MDPVCSSGQQVQRIVNLAAAITPPTLGQRTAERRCLLNVC
jgi:hypothetical protein